MKRRVCIALAWLVLWQLAAVLIHNPILMAGPLETLQALCALAGTEEFLQSVTFSFLRIVGGFLAGSAAGIVLALLAGERELLKEILAPLVAVLKSVPVASFIILALIWFGAGTLSFFISFVVVFPILYLNTLQGMESLDPKLVEMAEVFHMPQGARFRYVVLPGIYPFLKSGFALALGMSWKSGIAAELIGQYKLSIGNQLYVNKIMLDTAGVLAWTLVILLVSWAFEKIFLLVLSVPEGRAVRPGVAGKENRTKENRTQTDGASAGCAQSCLHGQSTGSEAAE